MYECENWTIKAECQRIVASEFWCCRRHFVIGRTDVEDEAPIFWPPDGKRRLTGKDPDAGKDLRQKEKEAAEDEMIR